MVAVAYASGGFRRLVYACPLAELARQTGQTARPARPGATETGECHGEKNPVWARVSKNDAIDR